MSDNAFVQLLIHKLEDDYHLKLCDPNRDLLGGGVELEDKIQLIKDR